MGISVAAVDASAVPRTLVAQETTFSQLLSAFYSTDCFTTQDVRCNCSTDGVSGNVSTSVSGCQSLGGQSSCLVAGGTGCSIATDANAFNSSMFPTPGPAFKPCPD